jgi:hypothetical protein
MSNATPQVFPQNATQQEDRMSQEASNIRDFSKKEYATEVKVTSDTPAVVRIFDGSNVFETGKVSWFICDDDKIRPFTIENSHEGKGILARLIGNSSDYYKGGYLESKKGQIGKVNVHQAKDPELFKRLTEYWNPGYKGPGSIKPRTDYVYNVIHRNPELIDNKVINWCVTKQHTKLLRVGPKHFKCLKTVRDNDGEFISYDILLSKEGSGTDTVPSAMKAGINVEFKVIGDLTAQEKEYAKYDLKWETRLASATYVLKYLRNTIERVDRVMGTSFVAELEKQKSIESAAFLNQHDAEAALIPLSQEAIMPQGPTGAAPAPISAFPQRQPVAEPSPISSRIPISASTETCSHCKEQIPSGLSVCPRCNGILQSPCDICHKPFSISASLCPHCGTVYQTGANAGAVSKTN